MVVAVCNSEDISPIQCKTEGQLRPIINYPDAIPSIKLYKVFSSRRAAAQLARLRTGHCSLNQFLHGFGFVESLKIRHFIAGSNISFMAKRDQAVV